MFRKNRIYLDHASATPIREEALRATLEAELLFGNPGSIHGEGAVALASLSASREKIALALACKSREVIFTSGLTEANNLGILGVAQQLDRRGVPIDGTHWITSAIEHDSVLECFAEIERLGGRITHLDPDSRGLISAEKVEQALSKETKLVSIGWANSEIGSVQPLSEISRRIRAHERRNGTAVLLHSDAGQAPLYLAPRVHTLDADLLSLGSGKLYGPRGIGALYAGTRAAIAPTLFGGGKERGLRPGTESVALAAGFAEALSLAQQERGVEAKRIGLLRDAFAQALLTHIPGAVLNGNLNHALPHLLNISVPNINSEYAVLALDRAGVALSTKAACSEGNRNYSHVVAALPGCEPNSPEGWRAKNTLRISLGRGTTETELRRAAKILLKVLASLP